MTPKSRTAYEDTEVAVYKSREGIDKLLRQIGVTAMQWAEGDHPEQPDKLLVALRFIRPEPTPAGTVPLGVRIMIAVPKAKTEKAQDQLLRQYHRVLHFYLKSQVEAVQFGLVQFTEAFLPHLETGNGLTVYQQIAPQYLQAVVQGDIRPLALLPMQAG